MDIFAKLDQAIVTTEPFPHIVLPDAVDPGLCDELLRTMPPLEVLSKGRPLGSNRQYLMRSEESLPSGAVSDAWKATIRAGLSTDFFGRVLRLFAPHIRQTYPDFERRFGPLGKLSGVPRPLPRGSRGAIGLDAQIGINTPPLVDGTSVRGPHLDLPNKVFVGLLYLRAESDCSTGGELQFSVPTQSVTACGPKYNLPPDRVQIARTIPYQRNLLVIMLNTPHSWHGVSPRSVTPFSRNYLNLVGEMSEPLFQMRIDQSLAEDDEPTQPLRNNGLSGWLRRLIPGSRRRFNRVA